MIARSGARSFFPWRRGTRTPRPLEGAPNRASLRPNRTHQGERHEKNQEVRPAVGYAALGLFEGLFVAAIFSFVGVAARDSSPGLPPFLAPFFGVASIVIFPILFGVIGAIGGGLGAVIYNVAARVVGGIEVEVE
jgi:hypothetical protein